MVNKQYTVHHPHLHYHHHHHHNQQGSNNNSQTSCVSYASVNNNNNIGKGYSPPPLRNLSTLDISDAPNPSSINEDSSIIVDKIIPNDDCENVTVSLESLKSNKDRKNCGKSKKSLSSASSYEKNITSIFCNFGNRESGSDSVTTFDTGHQKFTVNDLKIEDIGRFQYILQMDKEMGSHPDTLYRIPSRVPSPSNTSTINSTSHVNFWKACSESATTSMTQSTSDLRRKRKEIEKHLKHYWKYIKWPLLLGIFCLLFGFSLYFLIIDYQNENNSINHTTNITDNYYAVEEIISTTATSTVNPFIQNNQSDKILKIFMKNPKTLISSTTTLTHIKPIDDKTGPSRFQFDVNLEMKQKEKDVILLENSKQQNQQNFDFDDDLLAIDDERKIPINKVTERTDMNMNKEKTTTQSTLSRNTQIVKIKPYISIDFDDDTFTSKSTTETLKDQDLVIGKNMDPTKGTLQTITFTSGHQNNFGVPIEEDERVLKYLLNHDLINYEQTFNSTNFHPTTDSSVFLTKVSPTLPVIFTSETTTSKDLQRQQKQQRIMANNATDVEMCVSTSLGICRGILQYDLTIPRKKPALSTTELEHFRYLLESKCSPRAAEFICSALEPECRPSQMGVLQPCKRICKSILEPCASIIASSEILTTTFDCDQYPDSSDRNVCEDPTRRGRCLDNEFKCLDSSCIPLQWRCDNIKDCSLGEDEEECLLCQHEEFRCQSNDKCIPDKWRCDQYDDCPDGSDEMDCDDYDDDETFGSITSDGGRDEGSNPRIFSFASIIQSPHDQNGRTYVTINEDDEIVQFSDQNNSSTNDSKTVNHINLKNNTELLNDTGIDVNTNTDNGDEEIQTGEASGRIVTAIPRSLVNFQDSKEIMMTSDSENDFKYSKINQTRISTRITSTTSSSTSNTTSKPISTTTEKIDITTFKANLYCPENQLRCVSGKCITVTQICDRTIDCPDGADEAMCVYKDP